MNNSLKGKLTCLNNRCSKISNSRTFNSRTKKYKIWKRYLSFLIKTIQAKSTWRIWRPSCKVCKEIQRRRRSCSGQSGWRRTMGNNSRWKWRMKWSLSRTSSSSCSRSRTNWQGTIPPTSTDKSSSSRLPTKTASSTYQRTTKSSTSWGSLKSTERSARSRATIKKPRRQEANLKSCSEKRRLDRKTT